MKRVPGPIVAVSSYSVIVHLLILLAFLQPASRIDLHASEVDFLWIFLAISFCLVWIGAFSPSARQTRIGFACHVLVYSALQGFFRGHPVLDFLLGSALFIPVGLYERFPVNARFAVGGILVSSLARAHASGAHILLPLASLPTLVGIPLALAAIALAVSFMSNYREQLISTQIGFNRLDRSIGQLTRVNQEYQDSLVRAEDEVAKRERDRISRDLHDVVGYTLTNNIMLMEAAADMARLNPLGVTRLLNSARENAQEGLERIRETLYTLRSYRPSLLHGISAVAKLIQTFQTATGIKVTTSFGNVPVQLPAGVDYTVYHLVQESLVNSFRHGHVTRVDVMLSIVDDSLKILVTDDGAGSGQVAPGIGLNGMLERVSRHGGTITWEGGTNGFRIRATIPLEKAIDE